MVVRGAVCVWFVFRYVGSDELVEVTPEAIRLRKLVSARARVHRQATLHSRTCLLAALGLEQAQASVTAKARRQLCVR